MDDKRKRMRDIHNEVSPDYYDKSMAENLFQWFWHSRRIGVISKLLKGEGKKMLDIGCGGGTLLDMISSKASIPCSVGVDAAEQVIYYADRHHNKGSFFLCADFYELPFKENSFDIVTAMEVLEHLHSPEMALVEARRCLMDNGTLVVLVPNENNLLFRLIWFFWVMGKGKVWKHAHIQKFTDSKLISLIEKEGFNILNTKKFIFGMLMAVKAVKIQVSPKIDRLLRN